MFWSGRTEEVFASSVAQTVAKKYGSATLEMLMEKNGIVLPKYDINNPVSVDAWNTASREFAKNASGTVRVVLGRETRSGGVWGEIEFPALKANKHVTDIIAVDPKTGVEKVLYIKSSSL